MFTNFFLEYESAGVEESKTGFGFAIAQKLIELQPLTSKLLLNTLRSKISADGRPTAIIFTFLEGP